MRIYCLLITGYPRHATLGVWHSPQGCELITDY